MDWFTYQNGRLFCEQTAAADLAQQFGTPLYVYSAQTFRHHYDLIAEAFAPLDPLICYSIKSCGNVHILRLLAERGAGMDVVSGGELFRALEAGVPPEKIVYAGVGKTDEEIDESLQAGIGLFNIESEAEFENIAERAEAAGTIAHGALRINPDVSDERTHAKTTTGKKETKFGVDIERARTFFATYGDNPHLKLTAVHLHIGSPIYSAEPYVRAIEKTLGLIEQLRQSGHTIDTIDIGGGYAADYESGLSPAPGLYAEKIVPLLKDRGLKVILEPGRFIAGNAGILLSRVQYVKTGGAKRFAIMDSGMHHLVRPAMYEAFHFIWPAEVRPEHEPTRRAEQMDLPGLEPYDVVGPICETGDTLAHNRSLPPLRRGDLLGIFTAGAYGMVMASNYNAMRRPAEVLVDENGPHLIRRRETYEDLVAPERREQTA